MGKEILVAIIVVNFLVVVLHVVILVLLIKFNFGCFNANQRDIFIVLSFTELSYSVFDNISVISVILDYHTTATLSWTFFAVSITLMYMSLMVLITIDRFLVFYLNLKYTFYWSRRKTRIVLILLCIFSLLSYIPAAIYGLKNRHDLLSKLVRYIYPVFETIFMIVAFGTYLFIFRKHKKSLASQLNMYGGNKHKKSNNKFRLSVPTLIILTYFIFMVIPNFGKLCSSLKIIAMPKVTPIAYFLTPIGYLVDPVIYVFSARKFRLCTAHLISRQFACIAQESQHEMNRITAIQKIYNKRGVNCKNKINDNMEI